MLEENAKKRHTGKQNSRLSIQLSSRSQKHGASVFEDESDLPARKRQKKSRNADRDEASRSKKEEHIEDEDSNEEE